MRPYKVFLLSLQVDLHEETIERVIEIKTGIRLTYARYRKHTNAHKFKSIF